MKQTINFYDFDRAFIDMGRESNFSYEGRKALFEYLEELEEDCGIEIELDVTALCCDYRQDHWEAIASDVFMSNFEDQEECCAALENETSVIGSFEDGTILFQEF